MAEIPWADGTHSNTVGGEVGWRVLYHPKCHCGSYADVYSKCLLGFDGDPVRCIRSSDRHHGVFIVQNGTTAIKWDED